MQIAVALAYEAISVPLDQCGFELAQGFLGPVLYTLDGLHVGD